MDSSESDSDHEAVASHASSESSEAEYPSLMGSSESDSDHEVIASQTSSESSDAESEIGGVDLIMRRLCGDDDQQDTYDGLLARSCTSNWLMDLQASCDEACPPSMDSGESDSDNESFASHAPSANSDAESEIGGMDVMLRMFHGDDDRPDICDGFPVRLCRSLISIKRWPCVAAVRPSMALKAQMSTRPH